MAGFTFSTTNDSEPDQGVRIPETDQSSKQLMLCGETQDEVGISTVEERLSDNLEIPDELIIKQRTNTYYGPKLLVISNSGKEHLITAPGPDSHLLLWAGNQNDRGNRRGWIKLAEVTAHLIDDKSRYHLCQQCNEPLQTADHQRLAAIGQCPNVS